MNNYNNGQKVIVIAPEGYIFAGVLADAMLPGHLRLEKYHQIVGWDADKGVGAVANGTIEAQLTEGSDWIELPEFSYRVVIDATNMKGL